MSTICAISTAPGIGGIAVIRISGQQAIEVCDKLFFSKNKTKKLIDLPTHSLSFGEVLNPQTGETVDEVVVTIFRAPHSFTGENVVEISCHGSQYVQREILRLLLENGCRMAQSGEFTQRAFLNGKMDLSQAEAVADVIAAQSQSAHRLAMTQMRGGFSTELAQLREKLLTFTSLVELELDFSDHEDLEFADRNQLRELANSIVDRVSTLANSFEAGNAIKNGIPVAIVGKTNVGKSTLLNALLNEERAIVSNIHGTTRDVIEDTVTIQGVQFRFIDTAGIRRAGDEIEQIGIERTFEKIKQSSIVLWMMDGSCDFEEVLSLKDKIVPLCVAKKLLIIINKSDLMSDTNQKKFEAFFPEYPHLFISARNRQNILELEQLLIEESMLNQISEGDLIVTNMRHFEALKNAQNAINRVINGLNENISGDFLSQDIRECIYHLGEITGQISTDEVLGNIFSKFCIGK